METKIVHGSDTMSSEPNLYRTENYQNYINSFHRKPRVEKSISDVQKKIDDDNDSINSVAESLNNYLDVKVRVSDWWFDYVFRQRSACGFTFHGFFQVIDDTESMVCSIAEPESEKEAEREAEPMFRWERFCCSHKSLLQLELAIEFFLLIWAAYRT